MKNKKILKAIWLALLSVTLIVPTTLKADNNDKKEIIKEKSDTDENINSHKINALMSKEDTKSLEDKKSTSQNQKKDTKNIKKEKENSNKNKDTKNNEKKELNIIQNQPVNNGVTSSVTITADKTNKKKVSSKNTKASTKSSALKRSLKSTKALNLGSSKIHVIPVWGDAILIESNGHYCLIDSGEDSDNPRGFKELNFKVNDDLLVNYLNKVAIQANGTVHLDFIIATHAHSDHIGGFDNLINQKNVIIDKAYVKTYDETRINDYEKSKWDNQEVYNQLMSALNSKNIPVVSKTKELDKEIDFQDLKIQLYNTSYDTYPISSSADLVGENENSLVQKITSKVNNKSILLTADLNNITNASNPIGDEEALSKVINHVDVLKLGHHGYHDSSSDLFLNALSPKIIFNSSTRAKIQSNVENYIVANNVNTYQMPINGLLKLNFDSINFGMDKYTENKLMLINQFYTLKDEISTRVYYFDNSGIPVNKRWYKINNKWYSFYASGELRYGIYNYKNNNYHLDNTTGELKNGWRNENGWKYYDEYGVIVHNWKNIKGKDYYFDQNGFILKNWQVIENKKYYFNNNGEMATSWQKINNEWYYFNENGEIVKNWQKISSKWYYLDNNGKRLTSWQKISNKWYYFDKNGVMLINWKKIGQKWYYLGKSGSMKTKWQKINNKWYYLGKSGSMKINWQKVNNKWYNFGKSGSMKIKWQKIKNKWYYFSKSGSMKIYWQKIQNKWYYFNKSGSLWTKVGWSKCKKGWVYNDGVNGCYTNEEKKIKDHKYKFDKNGYYEKK